MAQRRNGDTEKRSYLLLLNIRIDPGPISVKTKFGVIVVAS
jgi:hypothetical protein